MQCPRCFKDDTSVVGTTHYVCNDPLCVDSNGRRTQFRMVYDEEVQFPFNEIFIKRGVTNFYRKPYLDKNEV